MLLKETLDQLPNARTWYSTFGDAPMRVIKRDWRELPCAMRGQEKPSPEDIEEYYEFRAVRTFDNAFDWELVK